MKKFKFRLWLALTALGIIGVASLLFSDLPLDNLPPEVTEKISPEALKWLILINPCLFVMIATAIGTLLYDKVNLSVPILEQALRKPGRESTSIPDILKYGLLLGLLAGILIVGISKLFDPYLPQALKDMSKSADLSLVTKLLYGGITEELLTRFGLMSLFVWLLFKVTKTLTPPVYWAAIALAAFLFALGHLPIVFQVVAAPTLPTYAYILLGNMAGGLVFGYAYWKKGLECAFIAHAFAHVTMVSFAAMMP